MMFLMWQQLIQFLVRVDKSIFIFINSTLHRNWLDGLMVLMRNPYTWVPLYLYLMYRVYKLEPKILLPFLIASLATFAITDYSSASIIKPLVGRLRPCFDYTLINHIRIVDGCGGRYSFPSSHASNHFGLAAVWYWMILFLKKEKWNWVWWWAGIICFAQVYVGKHFPMDMVGGAILGLTAGTMIAKLFEYWYKRRNTIFSIPAINWTGLFKKANKMA